MKKTTKPMKLQLNTLTLRKLCSDELAVAAGGATLSDQTRCNLCDSFTVKVTQCF